MSCSCNGSHDLPPVSAAGKAPRLSEAGHRRVVATPPRVNSGERRYDLEPARSGRFHRPGMPSADRNRRRRSLSPDENAPRLVAIPDHCPSIFRRSVSAPEKRNERRNLPPTAVAAGPPGSLLVGAAARVPRSPQEPPGATRRRRRRRPSWENDSTGRLVTPRPRPSSPPPATTSPPLGRYDAGDGRNGAGGAAPRPQVDLEACPGRPQPAARATGEERCAEQRRCPPKGGGGPP